MDGTDKYRLLFETLRQGVFFQSADGMLTDVNPAALEITGMTRDEFLGRTSMHKEWNIIDVEGKPVEPLNHPSMLALSTGKPVRDIQLGIVRSWRSDVVWVIVNALPCFRNNETKPFEVVVTFQDITELKFEKEKARRTEREVLEERELLKSLFQHGPVAYSVATLADRIIIEINDAWMQLFGYTREEVIGRTAITFDWWEHPEERAKAFKELQENRRLWDFEFSLKMKSGELRFASIYSAIIERNEVDYLVSVFIDLTGRKKAEADLDRFFNMVPDMACIASVDGYFKKLNKEWERVLGFSTQELTEQPMTSFIHPEDRDITLREKERQVRGESTIHFVNRYRTKDKAYRWLEWNATPSPDGQLLYAAARDITDRIITEKALRDSEIKFHEFFENISSGVAIYEVVNHGMDFILRDFNLAAERIDKCKKEDIIGKSIYEARPGIQEFGLAEVLRRVYQSGIPEEYPATYYKDNILQAWYHNYIFRLASGEIVVVFEDITERMRVQEQLRVSEQKYSRLFELESDALIMFDSETFRILEANRVTTDLYGYSREELLQMRALDLSAEPEKSVLSISDKSGMVPIRYHRKKNGEVFPVEITFNNFMYSGRLMIIGAVRDITDRQRAAEEILRSRQSLEDLNKQLIEIREEERTNISRELHDQLGQSLTAIKIDLSDFLKRVANNLEDKTRLSAIIDMVSDSIHDVQRISSDLRPEILYDLGLVPAMEWFTESFEKRTGIACRFESDESAYSDTHKNLVIFRILQESLTNVVRHSHASSVSVMLRQTKGRSVMTIMDNGIGFEPELIKSSESLGIIGMRERVRQLGGTLEISSGTNQGTTLTINLP